MSELWAYPDAKTQIEELNYRKGVQGHVNRVWWRVNVHSEI
jgi:hypothetical protein